MVKCTGPASGRLRSAGSTMGGDLLQWQRRSSPKQERTSLVNNCWQDLAARNRCITQENTFDIYSAAAVCRMAGNDQPVCQGVQPVSALCCFKRCLRSMVGQEGCRHCVVSRGA